MLNTLKCPLLARHLKLSPPRSARHGGIRRVQPARHLALTHSLTLSLIENFALTHSLTLSLIETFALTHSLTLSLIETFALAHSLTLSLIENFALTHSLTLSLIEALNHGQGMAGFDQSGQYDQTGQFYSAMMQQ